MIAFAVGLIVAATPVVVATDRVQGGSSADTADGGEIVAVAPDGGVGLRATETNDGLFLEIEAPSQGRMELVVELPSPAVVRPHQLWKGIAHPLVCEGVPPAADEPEEAAPPDNEDAIQACPTAQALPRVGTRRFTIGSRADAVPDLGTRTGMAPCLGGPVGVRTTPRGRVFEVNLSRADLPLTTAPKIEEIPWELDWVTQNAIADLHQTLLFRESTDRRSWQLLSSFLRECLALPA